MRFDLCYPSLKLIIEYDGRHHAEDSEQWLHDLKRREASTGWMASHRGDQARLLRRAGGNTASRT
jgi:hypothetical protein